MANVDDRRVTGDDHAKSVALASGYFLHSALAPSSPNNIAVASPRPPAPPAMTAILFAQRAIARRLREAAAKNAIFRRYGQSRASGEGIDRRPGSRCPRTCRASRAALNEETRIRNGKSRRRKNRDPAESARRPRCSRQPRTLGYKASGAFVAKACEAPPAARS
jgi:hypothetical protein